MRSIAVTGSRDTGGRSEAEFESLLAAYLGPFADADSSWQLGGASGIDTLALSWLLRHSVSRLTVAVPVRLADQPADAREQVENARAADRLDQLVELAHPEGRGEASYELRNRWLVDHSSLVVGFPLTSEPDGSGTWQTLQYAAHRKLPRLIVPLTDR